MGTIQCVLLREETVCACMYVYVCICILNVCVCVRQTLGFLQCVFSVL